MTKLYIFCLGFVLICSCKSATKLYNQGNYDDAVAAATKKLQKDPADGESKAVLQSAYRFALSRHEDQIRNLSNSANEDKYDRIVIEYSQLQKLYELIQQSPAAATAVKATDFRTYLQTYLDKAGDIHDQKGMILMQEATTKAGFRNAYREFKQAADFKSSDPTIQKKLQQAYDAALVKVVIEPMDPYMMGYRSNTYPLRTFQEDVIRSLSVNSSNAFLKFYSAWDAQSNKIQPDEVLEFRLGRMDIGHPYDQTSSRQISKDVVVREIVYKADSIVKQYGKVYAQINSVQRTMISQAELFIVSRDKAGRILWNDVFKGEHRWQTKFATYTGDERALSDNDRKMLNEKTNNAGPSEEEIVRHLLQQIQTDVANRLYTYFNRY